jgi:cell division protein ZapA
LSKSKARVIDVEIYDQKYSIILRKPLEESEVVQVAQEVDARMREISIAASTPDSLKIAILTALHLCQELRELRKNCESKADEWSRALEQVLKK